MSVCALLVLGDKIRNEIDEQTQEQWLLSYIGKFSFCVQQVVKDIIIIFV